MSARRSPTPELASSPQRDGGAQGKLPGGQKRQQVVESSESEDEAGGETAAGTPPGRKRRRRRGRQQQQQQQQQGQQVEPAIDLSASPQRGAGAGLEAAGSGDEDSEVGGAQGSWLLSFEPPLVLPRRNLALLIDVCAPGCLPCTPATACRGPTGSCACVSIRSVPSSAGGYRCPQPHARTAAAARRACAACAHSGDRSGAGGGWSVRRPADAWHVPSSIQKQERQWCAALCEAPEGTASCVTACVLLGAPLLAWPRWHGLHLQLPLHLCSGGAGLGPSGACGGGADCTQCRAPAGRAAHPVPGKAGASSHRAELFELRLRRRLRQVTLVCSDRLPGLRKTAP